MDLMVWTWTGSTPDLVEVLQRINRGSLCSAGWVQIYLASVYCCNSQSLLCGLNFVDFLLSLWCVFTGTCWSLCSWGQGNRQSSAHADRCSVCWKGNHRCWIWDCWDCQVSVLSWIPLQRKRSTNFFQRTISVFPGNWTSSMWWPMTSMELGSNSQDTTAHCFVDPRIKVISSTSTL